MVKASVTPSGKRGLGASNTVKAASSPEDTSSLMTSPAPRRRGRPRKNPVVEQATSEDETTLFNIIKNGKSSLQVTKVSFIF